MHTHPETGRPMGRLAVFSGGFASGILLAQYALPPAWLLPGAFLCLGLGCGALRLPWELRRRAVVFLAAMALSLGYDWLYVRQVQRPAEALAGREGVCAMTLLDYAGPAQYGARATVKLAGVPGKAVYYGGEELLDLVPGQTLTGTVRLQSAAHLREETISAFPSRGVFLLAYGRGGVTAEAGSMDAVRWWPRRLGRWMAERAEACFSPDTAGVLTAILTGDRTGLGETAVFSESGLYHILAVSGLHCGIVLAPLTALTKNRRLRAALGIPLLAAYALVTGGSPSVVRAGIMCGFLLAAPLFGRESHGPTALSAALLAILLHNPFAAASVGLQLSFGAAAGLLWLTPRVYPALAGRLRGRAGRHAAGVLAASLGAQVFTLPLAGYYFGTLTLAAPLSGLLCLWAAGGMVLLGLAGVFLAPVPLLGAAAARTAEGLTRYVLGTAGFLTRLPFHSLSFDNPYLKYWVVYVYVLAAAACRSKAGGRRKYLLAAVLAAGTLALTVGLGRARYGGDLEAVVLDVGQGQSVILASGGHFALVDCGSSNSWYDPGQTAAGRLSAMGCRRLDLLILTHYDSDHVSGVPGLLERLKVGTLLAPVPEAGEGEALLAEAERRGVSVRFVTGQERISWDRAALTVFPPLREGGGNEAGLTVLASAGEQDLLITGDMGAGTERMLLETFDLPDIEGLVAGHHGSKSSTSRELLEALRPETVCISVGSNSYGHPAEETLERLARQGCAIYRTDWQGSIHLTWNRGD